MRVGIFGEASISLTAEPFQQFAGDEDSIAAQQYHPGFGVEMQAGFEPEVIFEDVQGPRTS